MNNIGNFDVDCKKLNQFEKESNIKSTNSKK